MTDLANYLENFEQIADVAPAVGSAVTTDAKLESLRLSAFEEGYRAGWDDAVKAQSDDRTRISSGFGQHLQDLSFTYHEAYGHVMNAMAPLLDEIVKAVLPKLAQQTFAQHISDQLQSMAKQIGNLEVIVAVAPQNREAVRPLLDESYGFPIRLVEDDTLAEEQADIRFGETERQLDLNALLHSVAEAVSAFTHDNRRKVANG